MDFIINFHSVHPRLRRVQITFFVCLSIILIISNLNSFSFIENHSNLKSPRLQQLSVQIDKLCSHTLDEFWKEIEEQGAPLIEPIKGEPEHVWVTFLFKGERNIQNVVIMIDRGLWGDIPSNRMKKLAETDLWYRTYRFRNVLSQSGAFMVSLAKEHEPEWLIRQFVSSPRLPIQFHLDFGLMENHPTKGVVPNMVMANRHMRDVLLAKGYKIHFQEFNGGHEYINWRGTLSDELIALLGKQPRE